MTASKLVRIGMGVSFLVALICAMPGSLLAQNSPGASNDASTLEEVLVTAERKQARIQDVPASVTAIGGAELQRRAAHFFSEVLTSTPSVQVNMPYGTSEPPDFVVRGISATDAEQNQSKPIALYIDEGIRDFPLFESTPLFDIDRIEVLRGPQGTLYGKNATGGAINLVSKKPGFDSEGYLTLGYGNFNTRSIEGALQHSLIDNVLTARLAFTYLGDDGVIKQMTPGLGNLEQSDVTGVRLGFFFKPSDSFDATLRFTHNHSGGRAFTQINGFPGTPDFSSTYPSIAALPGSLRLGLSFFESATTNTPHRSIANSGVNLIANWQVADQYKLTSITTYDFGHWSDRQDYDGIPADMGLTENFARGARQFVQEVRLATSFSGPFNVQAGLFYSNDHVDIGTHYQFLADPRCVECNLFGTGDVGFVQNNSFNQGRDSYSGYARGEYKVLPELTLSAGFRHSHDKVSVRNYEASLGTRNDQTGFPSFSGVNTDSSFSNNSFEVGLDWKIAPDILGYASFKQGYRTGAVNASAFFIPEEITTVPPEEASALEVGFKSTLLERRLTLNVAAFQTDYKNQQVQQAFIIDGAFLFPLLSIPKARIRGAELEMSARPQPGMTLSANVSFLDPKYTDGQISYSGVSYDVTGNQIIGSVKLQSSVSGDFTLMQRDSNALTLNVNATYSSQVYYDIFETKTIGQSGHTVANARLAYEMGKYTVSLYGKNIFQEKYVTIGYANSPNYLLRGTPRQFGVQATARF